MSVMNTLSSVKRLVRGPGISLGNRHARIIAVAARKGGVGKTTTTVNLGASLASHQNLKVLLLDMDAQGHVGMSLKAKGPLASQEALSDILLQKRRDVMELARPTAVDGLWMVPSDTDLNHTESVMSTRIGKELLLRNALRTARTHFDVILIDCPPNLGTLTANALVAADQVLIPCDLSTLSLDGVETLIETLETIQETLNPAVDLLGLVRTRVDRRNRKMNEAIESTLEEKYGRWLLRTEIGVSSALTKAQHVGLPAFMHDESSRGAEAYVRLAEEIASLIR